MSTQWRRAAREAADIWREATFAIALTGAGISVPSGIPDFRSPEGLWSIYDPAEVATVQALRSNPTRVWEFLVEASHLFGAAQPNPAHTALARLEQAGKLQAIVTQNVDGLHQAAGAENVLEFHGSARRFYCMGCRADHRAEDARELAPDQLPWRCAECGDIVRPDFVFFGEHIPPGVLSRSLALAQKADLAVIVGTSGEVAPANTLAFQVKSGGGKVIEINLGQSFFGDMPDVVIRAGAEEVLPEIAAMLTGG